MQTVTLTTCDNAAEAHLLQGALANAGIESVLTNEYTASTLPNLCGMMGMGVTVVVLAKDYDRARQLLNTLSPASGQPCCPLLRLDRHRDFAGAPPRTQGIFCVPFATGLDAARQYQDFLPLPPLRGGFQQTGSICRTNSRRPHHRHSPGHESGGGTMIGSATETATATGSPAGSATETGLYR